MARKGGKGEHVSRRQCVQSAYPPVPFCDTTIFLVRWPFWGAYFRHPQKIEYVILRWIEWFCSFSSRRHVSLLSRKTCLLVEQEDMSPCSTRRNVFLFNTKKCLPVPQEGMSPCWRRRHGLFLRKKTWLQQEGMSSCSRRRHVFLSNTCTRRHVFLLSTQACLLVRQEDMPSCSTRQRVFVFNKETSLLVQQEDMSSVFNRKTCRRCTTRSNALLFNRKTFAAIRRYLSQCVAICYDFAAILPLFATICNYSSLFVAILPPCRYFAAICRYLLPLTAISRHFAATHRYLPLLFNGFAHAADPFWPIRAPRVVDPKRGTPSPPPWEVAFLQGGTIRGLFGGRSFRRKVFFGGRFFRRKVLRKFQKIVFQNRVLRELSSLLVLHEHVNAALARNIWIHLRKLLRRRTMRLIHDDAVISL